MYSVSYRVDASCDSYRKWQQTLAQLLWPCLHLANGTDIVHSAIEARQKRSLRLVKTASTPLKIFSRPGSQVQQPTPCFSIALVLQGRIEHCTAGKEQILLPGDLLLTDNQQAYDLGFTSSASFISMPMAKASLPRNMQLAKGLAGGVLRRDQPAGVVMGQLMRTTFEQLPGLTDAQSNVLEGALQQLAFDTLLKARSPRTRQATRSHQYLLGEITRFVDNHACDPEITPDRLSEHFGISLRQLYNMFSPLSITPASYIWRCRLEQSRRLLGDPRQAHMTMTDVAFSCGFCNASHFSKAFRQQFGCSPSDYRQHEYIVHAGNN
ncbi:helix-turn-helix domain-containing protein [Pseudomonas sp. NPDC008258]|uniref:helix-turn-helix domain-containing protein n=1 Tax=Pseudomonas sp. NPDC008258 TaxID=3364418 RepID=UPI0036EE3FA5